MDVFLTRDAGTSLEALRRLAPKRKAVGFLLGHTRARRVFVERVFPVPRAAWPGLEEFYRLDLLFEGRIIGFFAFDPDERTKRRLLAPFAAGKAFLEIGPARPAKKIEMTASVVDFDGRFRFARLPLLRERAAQPPV
jgi:hypothetical protein